MKDKTNYKEAAARLSEKNRKIFLKFESQILKNIDDLEQCPSPNPDVVGIECKDLCHGVWGLNTTSGESYCPCYRFGEEEAVKRLSRLCRAIEKNQ